MQTSGIVKGMEEFGRVAQKAFGSFCLTKNGIRKINILGTDYTIEILDKKEDKFLNNERDGYCDKTSKRIVVCKEDEDSELDNYEVYLKSILRHEIVHAFLFESGLHENFSHPQFGHEETMVDWIATQAPKLFKAFQELDII